MNCFGEMSSLNPRYTLTFTSRVIISVCSTGSSPPPPKGRRTWAEYAREHASDDPTWNYHGVHRMENGPRALLEETGQTCYQSREQQPGLPFRIHALILRLFLPSDITSQKVLRTETNTFMRPTNILLPYLRPIWREYFSFFSFLPK